MSTETDRAESSVVTTGTFDGLHRGHVMLLETLRREASLRGARPVVVTFDRHPLEVICPERAPLLLVTPEERDRRLAMCGVDVAALSFDDGMRAMTARSWMSFLRDRYGAGCVILGYDNSFGRDGAGMTLADYEAIGAGLGLAVKQAPLLPGVSSSAIRNALASGDIPAANEMLGYEWTLTGEVVQGRHVGRGLGFRTANLEANPRLQLPAPGVYASEVTLGDGSRWAAVTNIGVRPTFDDGDRMSVETHIPGFEGDLYGSAIVLKPVRRLRGEMKFSGADELRDRIALDVKEALECVRASSCIL